MNGTNGTNGITWSPPMTPPEVVEPAPEQVPQLTPEPSVTLAPLPAPEQPTPLAHDTPLPQPEVATAVPIDANPAAPVPSVEPGDSPGAPAIFEPVVDPAPVPVPVKSLRKRPPKQDRH